MRKPTNVDHHRTLTVGVSVSPVEIARIDALRADLSARVGIPLSRSAVVRRALEAVWADIFSSAPEAK